MENLGHDSYGLEGNSYMGKTTTLELLQRESESFVHERLVITVPEYTQLDTIPSFRREDTADMNEMVEFFLELERRRTHIAVEAVAKDGDSFVVVFDRTPITLILFEASIHFNNDGRNAGLLLAERFQKAYEDQEIIVPSNIIHLTSNPQTFEARRQADLSKGNRDCIPLLLSPITRRTFDTGIALLDTYLGSRFYQCIHVDTMPSQKVAEHIGLILSNHPQSYHPNIDLVSFTESVLALKIK